MFGRKRKQEEDDVGLAGLGTGGQDPFSSLSMGGHEPFSSPDPAVQVTVQPSQTTTPIPAPPTTGAVEPAQITPPGPAGPQAPSPAAGNPAVNDPIGMMHAIQAGGMTGNPAAVLGQILSGHGPVGELVAQIKADPEAFRARIMAQAQAAGVSTVVVSPQWYGPHGGGPAQPIAGPAQPAHVDVIDELTKAADLHHQGALTDDEFQALKKKLLGE